MTREERKTRGKAGAKRLNDSRRRARERRQAKCLHERTAEADHIVFCTDCFLKLPR